MKAKHPPIVHAGIQTKFSGVDGIHQEDLDLKRIFEYCHLHLHCSHIFGQRDKERKSTPYKETILKKQLGSSSTMV